MVKFVDTPPKAPQRTGEENELSSKLSPQDVDQIAEIFHTPLNGAYTTEDSGLQILPAQASYAPTPTGTLGGARQFIINNLTSNNYTSLPTTLVVPVTSLLTVM